VTAMSVTLSSATNGACANPGQGGPGGAPAAGSAGATGGA
jgi:hypothetical protein